MIDIATAAATALETAHEEWIKNVVDSSRSPKSLGRIDTYIRSRTEGLGWTWEDKYKRDGQFAWCGAFACFCWRVAGLHQDVARFVMSSTYRIDRWGGYRSPTAKWDGRMVVVPEILVEAHPELEPFADRAIDVRDLHAELDAMRAYSRISENAMPQDLPEILPGDILLVGKRGEGRKPYGGHVVIAMESPDTMGYVTTFEGNATGLGPKGCHEGVIQHRRPCGGVAKGKKTYVLKVRVRPSWVDLLPLEYE